MFFYFEIFYYYSCLLSLSSNDKKVSIKCYEYNFWNTVSFCSIVIVFPFQICFGRNIGFSKCRPLAQHLHPSSRFRIPTSRQRKTWHDRNGKFWHQRSPGKEILRIGRTRNRCFDSRVTESSMPVPWRHLRSTLCSGSSLVCLNIWQST